jgi:hypothetical protein
MRHLPGDTGSFLLCYNRTAATNKPIINRQVKICTTIESR